jgi:hypothetical protein
VALQHKRQVEGEEDPAREKAGRRHMAWMVLVQLVVTGKTRTGVLDRRKTKRLMVPGSGMSCICRS